MVKNLYITFFFCFLVAIVPPAFSQETCSRIAVVNFQEILVDTSTYNKGEGLRYYLDKDEKAKELLNQYQSKNKLDFSTALLGTVGTGLIVTGLFRPKASETTDPLSRETLFLSGISLIFINFLVARTVEYSNESILSNAIDEYNKRNLPKIYFAPFRKFRGSDKFDEYGVGISTDF